MPAFFATVWWNTGYVLHFQRIKINSELPLQYFLFGYITLYSEAYYLD